MSAIKINYFLFAVAAALCIFSACGNGNDYKDDKDSISKQSAVVEQTNVDTNAINNGGATVGPVADTTSIPAASAATADTKKVVVTHSPAKKGHKGHARMAAYSPNYTAKMEEDKNGIYNFAEVKPTFPGGEKELDKFIQDNIKYPQDAMDNGVEGTVIISFAVNENGKVFSPKLTHEKLGYGLDEEALAAVRKMPKWSPGRVKGKNVKTYYSLPITFTLAD